MISSTARSERLGSLALALAACAVFWAITCALGGALSLFAEVELGAHLWRGEEWMQLLASSRYPQDRPERILVIGPSEARELFWEAPFREVLPGVRLINDSISMSHLEDGVTQLEYIERAYGARALGGHLILAVTHRFVIGFTPGQRPLPIVIDRYSPRFRLDQSVEPQALVEKGQIAGTLARLRLAAHSTTRYRAALQAARAALEARASGEPLEDVLARRFLVGSRYFHRAPFDKQQYYDAVSKGGGLYIELREMDPRPRRAAILRDFARLRQIAARNHTRLIVVQLPEAGWLRDSFYAAGVHEAYARVLREAVGDTPFLDLREALPDDGFFDFLHVTRVSGLALSRRVAQEIRRLDSR